MKRQQPKGFRDLTVYRNTTCCNTVKANERALPGMKRMECVTCGTIWQYHLTSGWTRQNQPD